MTGARDEGGDDRVVVVPWRVGALHALGEAPGPRRPRDELDGLVDELFPDTDEPPGWFDVGLLAVGAALAGWAVVTGRTVLLAIGLGLLALGVVLPARYAWRRLERRRAASARRARLADGVALRVDHPGTARLVEAHGDLLGLLAAGPEPQAVASGPAAVAHEAVLEVATLLDGRPPASALEAAYVADRAAAIERLAAALRAAPGPQEAGAEPGPEAVAAARAEVDALAGSDTPTRLDELAAEARRPHDA